MGLFSSLKKKKDVPEAQPLQQAVLPSGDTLPPRPKGQFPNATGMGSAPSSQPQQMLQPMQPAAAPPELALTPGKAEVPPFPTLSQDPHSPPPAPGLSTPPNATPTALSPNQQQAAGAAVKQAIHQPVQEPPAEKVPAPVPKPVSEPTSLFDMPDELPGSSGSLFSDDSHDDLSGLDLEKPETEAPKDDLSALDKGLMEPSFGMSVFGEGEHEDTDFDHEEHEEAHDDKGTPKRQVVESIPEGTPYSRGRKILHQARPLFVGVSEYVSILDSLKDVHNVAKQLEKDTLALDALRKKVASHSDEWHKNLDEVHKRLAFIDRLLYEG